MFPSLTKKDVSILLGNALDHFDLSLFSFFAPLLGPVFFPTYDPVVQLILTYGLSITSLFSKPIGTVLFGMIARNHGPLVGLSYSLIGVAITTMCIGCVPSYADIGWCASLVLMGIRIIRGICASGESTIAKLYIMEGRSNEHALKVSYLYQSSSMLGTVFASVAATCAIGIGYPHAWRICFWLGGITGFVGYFLRRYKTSQKQVHAPNLFASYQRSSFHLLWRNKNNVGRVAIATVFSYITYTIPFVFMNSFMPLISSVPLKTMMALNTSLLMFDMVLIPVIGHLLARFDPIKVMVVASTTLGITLVPLFSFLPNASLGYITGVRMWIVVWGVIFLCPLHFWSKALFKRSEQYFFVGIGGALGTATLGRMTTSICLWIWYMTGIACAPALYLTAVMLTAAYAVKTGVLREVNDQNELEAFDQGKSLILSNAKKY